MSVLGFAHDEARAVELGQRCAECGAGFVKASGFPVVCGFCGRRGADYPVSQYEESQKVAHANEARKRRERKHGVR